MFQLLNRFKKAYEARDISFNYESFVETFYNFSFIFIYSVSDLNTEIEEEIEDKIRETQDLVINEYEEKNEITNKRYLLICLERMMIIIEETKLTLIDKYLKIYRDQTVLFLSKSQEFFQKQIKIDYSIENEKNKVFINSLYQNLKKIKIKKNEWMINKFWNIIKECLLIYLLKKNCHLTFSNRIEKFKSNPENALEMKELRDDECIQLCLIGFTDISFIHLYYSIKNDFLFVVKTVNEIHKDSRLQEREIRNLSQTSHPFLPKFYGIFEHSQQKPIAIEFINGCTLRNFIKPEVDYEKRMKIIIEIMIVLEYLHDHKFIYRDLKPNNVMIDLNDSVVLIDFDRMIKSDVEITGTYIHSIYLAPEENYRIESDIFCLGLIIYFILTGKDPDKKVENENEFDFEDIPKEFKKIKDICYKCTKTKPEDRPSITKLIVELYVDYYELFKKKSRLFESILVPLSKSENPRSQCELGILHYKGKSVEKDDRKAFQLFCLSANQNYPKALHYLGKMYYKGNKYFPRNTSIAYQYFSRSSLEYAPSKKFCELIEQNSKNFNISFQKLPVEIQSRIDNIKNPMLKKIYSNFQFHYLSLYEIYSNKDVHSEQLITDYLLNTLKQFKLITYKLLDDSDLSFLRDIFKNKRKYSESNVNVVICTEGNCFLIECIDEFLITTVFDLTKSSLINLSYNSFGLNEDEQNEIRNFNQSLNISFTSDDRNINYPIISYMIRRYFYPSYFFKDPSFFIFESKSQNNEIETKKKIKILLASKSNTQNDVDYQNKQSEIYKDINKSELQNNIYTFQEQDFVILRIIHSNSEVAYYLVMHKERLFIFMMKKFVNQEKFEKEIIFCSKYSHRCLTKFYGFVKCNENIVGFIYEFMSNGNLNDYLNYNSYEITPIYVNILVSRIFQGIDYLHSNSLVHTNLNHTKILIDHDCLPFISDFNLIDTIHEEKEKSGDFVLLKKIDSHHSYFSSNIHSFYQIIRFLSDKYLKHQQNRLLDEIIQIFYKNKESKQIQYADIKNFLMTALESSDILINCEDSYNEMNEKIHEEFIQYIYENIIINRSTSIISFAYQIIPFLYSKPDYSLPQSLNNKKITIPKFKEAVEECEYQGCISVEEIIFETPSLVTFIKSLAFDSCSSLTKIILPSSLKKIDECAFKGCSSLTQIIIPSSVTKIGAFAFYQCKMLVEITIPLNVTYIGYSTFEMCQSLICISIPKIKEIKSCTYKYCSSLHEITIPSSVTSIGNSAFLECSSSKKITIPSSVTSIGDSAFSKCTLLKRITIPSSVTSIGDSAFSKCSSLKEIMIPSSVASIGDYVFYGCSSLREIMIPSSVTSIGNSAFLECSSLKEITIPSSVTSIGYSAFSKCSSMRKITIPSSVASIGDQVFAGCSSLIEIMIPSSVTSIGHSDFLECSSLREITISSSVTSIGNSAFTRCSSLKVITIPSSVTSIGNYAFIQCSSLEKITIPSSVTSIGDSAFSKCSSLKEITIQSSVTSIGDSAFYGCSSLIEIIIPSSVTSISDYAFTGCSSMREIKIPSSVTSIGDSAFYGCSSLREITIPSFVTSIGNYAFLECSSLEKAIIPSSVTSIGNSVFAGCSSLREITIPSSVNSVGKSVFKGCSSLKKIIYTLASNHSFENFESGHQLLPFVSNWKKFQQNKVDKSIQVENIMNEQKNKDDSPYFDILSNILLECHPVEGRQRAILISTGSFCPIHKGHLKLLDIAASFLSKEHKIDTLLGIISPKSDLFVSLKYGQSAIRFEDRCEMSRLACKEHNLQKSEDKEILHIVTDTRDGSQVDFIDFQFVYNRLKKEINEKFSAENLLVLFVCGGDMFNDRQCSEREFIVGISREEFRIETETSIQNHLYICSDQIKQEEFNIKVTKDNFIYVKGNVHESVCKYLHDVVHWI